MDGQYLAFLNLLSFCRSRIFCFELDETFSTSHRRKRIDTRSPGTEDQFSFVFFLFFVVYLYIFICGICLEMMICYSILPI